MELVQKNDIEYYLDNFKGKKNKDDYRLNYDVNVELWKKYMDVYLGGINMKNSVYLPKEFIETREEYNSRFDNSFYPNFSKKVINDYSKYIFKSPPIREGVDIYIDKINYVSENNEVVNINMFWREYFKKLLIYGEMFYLIDEDENDNIALSNYIRKKNNIKYKIQIVNPINVPVYNKNRIIIDINENEYLEFNTYGIGYFEKNKLVEVKLIKNFIFPIGRGCIDEDSDGQVESLLRDIADINIQLYQLESSLLVDFKKLTYTPFMYPINEQTKQFLEEYYGKVIRLVNGEEVETIDFKLREIMPYPAESDSGEFLTKDTKFIDQKQVYVKSLQNEIRQLASQRFEEMRAQSGIAKYMDIEDSNIGLVMLSDIMQNIEINAWEKWFKIVKNEDIPDNISIEYIKNFDIKNEEEQTVLMKEYLKDYFFVSETATQKILNVFINKITLFSKSERELIDKDIIELVRKNEQKIGLIEDVKGEEVIDIDNNENELITDTLVNKI